MRLEDEESAYLATWKICETTYQRSTEDCDTARKDEFGRLSVRPLVLSCGFEAKSNRIDVDLHTEIKVVFGSSGHDAV